MGMSSPRPGGAVPTMNVTPLVDVVLVLLIVFMVVAPLLSKKFSLALPKSEEAAPAQPTTDVPIVLTVNADGKPQINGEALGEATLGPRLARMLAARGDKTVYFDASDGAPFGAAVRAMDIARAHGATNVAILTTKVSD